MSSLPKKPAAAHSETVNARGDVLSSEVIELKQVKEKLENELRRRDELFSIAAHELRNPLNALHLTLAGIIRAQSGSSPLDGEQLLSRVHKAAFQVKRLADLIDEMLTVSRIAAGRLQFKIEEFDAAALLKEIVERSSESASPISLHAPAAITMRCDRSRFEQIATNLISNAIKFGDGKPVEVRLESMDASVQLKVIDHGIGMSAEDQARIFERFDRPGKGATKAGFGLGLWIASETIKALHGQIRVISKLGAGSTFIIELPRTNSMDSGQ
ncbi:MAG TPA: HAMP domain-containing sensor histidine kinase [Candidatus Binataceae bacterium]|nr:HAMP domain-containing sensor histidine kinase [Candidatus Binataceae bacterium]